MKICKVLKRHQETLMIKEPRDIHSCPILCFSVLKRNQIESHLLCLATFEHKDSSHTVAVRNNSDGVRGTLGVSGLASAHPRRLRDWLLGPRGEAREHSLWMLSTLSAASQLYLGQSLCLFCPGTPYHQDCSFESSKFGEAAPGYSLWRAGPWEEQGWATESTMALHEDPVQ